MVAPKQANGDLRDALEHPNANLRDAQRIKNYTTHWDKDSAKDTHAHTKSRLSRYVDVVNGYYDGATGVRLPPSSQQIPTSDLPLACLALFRVGAWDWRAALRIWCASTSPTCDWEDMA